MARLLLVLAAGLPVAGVSAFPCFDVATAQTCWEAYRVQGEDPNYDQAEAYLLARVSDTSLDPELAPGVAELSLAQLAFLRRDFEGMAEWARPATLGCWLSRRSDCELQARRFRWYALQIVGRNHEAIWEAEKLYALSRAQGSASDQVKAASTVARQRLWSMDNAARALRVLKQTAPQAAQVAPDIAQHFENWRSRAAMRLGYADLAQLTSLHTAASAAAADNEPLAVAAQLHRIEARLGAGARTGDLETELNQIIAAEDGVTVNGMRALLLRRKLSAEGSDKPLLEVCLNREDLDNLLLQIQCGTALAIDLLPAQRERAAAIGQSIRTRYAKRLTPEMALTLSRLDLRVLWSRPPGPGHVQASIDLLGAAELQRSLSREGNRAAEFLAFMNDDHYWVAEQIALAVEREQLPASALRRGLAILEAARLSQRQAARLDIGIDTALDAWMQARSTRPDTMALDHFVTLEAPPEDEQLRPARTAGDHRPVELSKLEESTGVVFFQWHHNPELGRRAWLVSGREVATYAVSNSRSLTRKMRRLEQVVTNDGELAALLTEIAEALLPITQKFGPTVENLIWIPDGELNAVPLAALDINSARLSRALQYASLRQVLEHSPARSPRAGAPVVLARPDYASHRDLPDLPAAEREAKHIARSVSGTELYLGAAATREQALASLKGDAPWLHFAAHLELEGSQPSQSGLQLSLDRSGRDALTVADLEGLKIPPKVVVLSSCQSAAGRRLTGEGVIGFSSTLLGAGASAVVANLWPVDDAYAAEFVQRWYLHLTHGLTIAQSMQKTRQEFAGSGYPPSAWAGWLVLGDGAVGLTARKASRWPWLLAAVLLGILAGIFAARTRRDQPN